MKKLTNSIIAAIGISAGLLLTSAACSVALINWVEQGDEDVVFAQKVQQIRLQQASAYTPRPTEADEAHMALPPL